MSDDRRERADERRSRLVVDSGKGAVRASSIVAGVVGMGLTALLGTGIATANADDNATTPTIPGPGDTVVFLSGNTINFPFGGVGENNFFGAGNGGNGGAGIGIGGNGTGVGGNGTDLLSAGIATANAHTDLATAMDDVPVTLTGQTIVLPGAYDTIVLPSDNTINFPFGGVGENNFLSPGNPGADVGVEDNGTEVPGAATANPDLEVTTPVYEFTIPLVNDTIVLPGSHVTIVFPSDNIINFPFTGDGENTFLGYVDEGPGGAGGIATGNADNAVTTPMDQAPVTVPPDTTFLPGSDDT
ncbi:MAG: hypothetical protein ACRDTN_14580, partial [Mycobacterium sp.]